MDKKEAVKLIRAVTNLNMYELTHKEILERSISKILGNNGMFKQFKHLIQMEISKIWICFKCKQVVIPGNPTVEALK